MVLLLLILLTPVDGLAGFTIHSAEEVLERWTVREAGVLIFESPEGDRWALVTDIQDPVIQNPGLGDFFPAEPGHVNQAMDALSFPLDNLSGDIFILPYPRRELLPSSAGQRSVYLSPGVIPLNETRIHALLTHEIGHIVHKTLLPDWDRVGWEKYRNLRGIEDTRTYRANADHRNRPHEIFAEDFRGLFGGTLANYSGSIENSYLTPPWDLPDLEPFYRSLNRSERIVSYRQPPRPLRGYPNPTRGPVGIKLVGVALDLSGGPFDLAVFDLRGRLITRQTLSPATPAWDGSMTNGAPAPSGMYFLRVKGNGDSWQGKVLITP